MAQIPQAAKNYFRVPDLGEGRLHRFLPILGWLPAYKWGKWLRADLIAGISVAALLIPESLAYAGIAGVSPEIGLYAAPLALIGYAVFGRSKLLVVATSSSVAAVSAAVVGDIAADDESFVVLTAGLALMAGIVFLILGLLRFGWVANFLSKAVLEGFIIGLSISIIIGQLDELLGVELDGHNALLELGDAISKVAHWDGLTVAVGVVSLASLFVIERFLPRLPGALTVVVLAIVAVTVFELDTEGLLIVGAIPTGLPSMGVPDIDAADLSALLAGALAVVLIGFSEAYAAATDMAKTTGEKINADQELIAYGVANVGAGISSGMVVAGSLSKSKANEAAGAKTQVSNIINAVIALLTLLFLAALFEKLPLATLAAVVIHALWHSANPRKLAPFWKLNRFDFTLGFITLVSVLLFDTLPAVIIGVVLSLLVVIYRVSFPHTAELGRDRQTGVFEDLALHPEAERVYGVVLYRFDASLIYSNALAFETEARRLVAAASPPAQTLVIDGEMMANIDSTGREVMAELIEHLADDGVEVVLARFHGPAIAALARHPELEPKVHDDLAHSPSEAVRRASRKHDDPAADD
ncbi:MAG: SulP family inorganic anion transporter [Acidimicrobiales bacterium]